MLKVQKCSATDALKQINELRKKAKVKLVHKSTVHRYAGGLTHKRGAVEKRGRKKVLSKLDVRRLDQWRRRLVKRADNTYRVTYKEVIKEAALPQKPGHRVCKEALRNLGVSYKAPRRKISVSAQDAKKRWDVAKVWMKRRSTYCACICRQQGVSIAVDARSAQTVSPNNGHRTPPQRLRGR
jgi:hypothetical protein